MTEEWNFDGLIGPTHNYAGIAAGNVASQSNKGAESNPQEAALEGLKKMRMLYDLGVPQGVLPPQPRPRLDWLRALGFSGDTETVLRDAAREGLLSKAYSASSMWSANAATISPSEDSQDGRVHLSAANLVSGLHRSLEARQTDRVLRAIFPGDRFVHHGPLPASRGLADEGAANHIRLHKDSASLQVFVYGDAQGATRFLPRQARGASEAIARRHRLKKERVLYLQQAVRAVDAGAFHNDVVSVGHEQFLLWHEDAFEDESAIEAIRSRFEDLVSWRVSRDELSLEDAVKTYLFNSQIVTTAAGPVLIAPSECEAHAGVKAVIERLRSEGLHEAHFVDVRQSMRNGGGPACLRLRVALTEEESHAVHSGIRFTPTLHDRLNEWVKTHYRDRLRPEDLLDPQLITESQAALETLAEILTLPPKLFDVNER